MPLWAPCQVTSLLVGTSLGSALAPQLAAPLEPAEIVGGVPTVEGELDAVVLLTSSVGRCSGSLVAPRVVLTAAHCIDELDEDAPLSIGFGTRGDEEFVMAESFGIHPRYCGSCEHETFDIAYVQLPRDHEPRGGFLRPLTDRDEWEETMRVGNVVLLAGYGTDDPLGEDSAAPRKRKVTTTITEFSDNGFEFYAGGRQRDTCKGDSGGPALVPLGHGGVRLAGVTSRGSSPCGSGGWYGVPYPALFWVQSLTGAQLLPTSCDRAGCFDLVPVDEAQGCRVGVREAFGGWLWVLSILPAFRRRRRVPPT